jgi:hypothetical protein
MPTDRTHAPIPDLRIVPTSALRAHEDHDSQRSQPLMARLQTEAYVINPPVVAPMDAEQFVILDGANRCYAFAALGYPHMLVQVAAYDSGYVELQTWNHVITDWDAAVFLDHLAAFPDIDLHEGQHHDAIAHIILTDGRVLALLNPVNTAHERSAALRQFVSLYQQRARLHRTTLSEPREVWPQYENAIALVQFPRCQPADIVAAARYGALLPPGVSRHIVHGRALRINYPLAPLRDDQTPLADKNEALRQWMRRKLANREIRYYAETTYQFDE